MKITNKSYCIFLLTVLFTTLSILSYGNSFKNIKPAGLIKKMSAAIDPNGVLTSTKTKQTVGKAVMPLQKIKVSVVSQFKMPDKYLIITTFPDGQKQTQAYNGKTAWSYNSKSKKKTILSGKDKDAFIFNAMLASPKSDIYSDLFERMKVDNSYYKVGKYECYKLTCYPKAVFKLTEPYVFYVDNKNFLIRKMDLTIYLKEKPLKESILSKDYKNILGIKFAMKTTTNILGSEIDYYTKDIKFNIPVNDKVFD
jgi:outer membrane lipoprotein-sorting protein